LFTAVFYAVALLTIALTATPARAADPDESGRAPGGVSDRHSVTFRRIERSLEHVQSLIERYGYWASVAAVMAEGVGIPLPGQTLLVASSLEAAGGRMNIVMVLVLVTAAASIGNGIGYAIGRWGGRAVLHRLKINPVREQRLEDLFKRRGGPVILVARFVDGLRQLNGIVAGILQMPWWIFSAYNVGGALLWTCVWGLGTYFLGRDIHVIADSFHRPSRVLYVLSVIAVVALVAYLLQHGMRGASK
jgi:membrane protein DedA with SNARE-associated domain